MISACSKMTSTSGSVETLRTVRSALHDNPDGENRLLSLIHMVTNLYQNLNLVFGQFCLDLSFPGNLPSPPDTVRHP